jgi:hypothetical protein
MSKLEARERFFPRFLKELEKTRSEGKKVMKQKRTSQTSPSDHYHIGESERLPLDITVWLGSNLKDRVTKVSGLLVNGRLLMQRQGFLDKLKDHLIQRLRGDEFDGEMTAYPDEERDKVIILHNTMYSHKTLSVNYTTYDLRREQDTINPSTHADIMLLSQETDANRHPYWYARVIGIFHVNVRYLDGRSHNQETHPSRIEVLFVRWFGRNLDHRAGFAARRLPRIGFIHEDDEDAFGFLDPDLVIRGIHLIPTFRLGRTSDLLQGPSLARGKEDHDDEDWRSFDINM